MRRTPARTSGRLVSVHGVRWWRRAIGNDDWGVIIAAAESDAGNAKLHPCVSMQMSAGVAACLLAFVGRILEGDRRWHVGQRVRETPGIGRIAARKGLPLDLIAVEQRRRRVALDHVSKLPAEVHGILDGGVVAEATCGRE